MDGWPLVRVHTTSSSSDVRSSSVPYLRQRRTTLPGRRRRQPPDTRIGSGHAVIRFSSAVRTTGTHSALKGMRASWTILPMRRR